MDRRQAFAWIAFCTLALASSRAAARDISVYGLELDVSGERERLLIFADAPLSPQLLPVDERTVMIALPGSVLDPSAPTQIVPNVQGTVVRVTAFERAEGAREVRVVVQRRPGAEPRIEKRGSVIALDFDALPRGAAGGADTIRVAYRNTPITQVVTDLARATGESIVFDDAAAALGAVTIEGPPQVTRGEALALIDSLLLLRGFAAVPGPGGVRKIVPIQGAPSVWSPSGRIPDSDAPITTMLRLENAAASELVPILTPYLGTNAFGAAYEPTNSLILSGPASLLRTLRVAIEALDENRTGAPLIWPMRIASAETVADQLLEIAGERDVPFVSYDVRLNALLLRVRPGEAERIRALVDRLDRPAHGAAGMQVLKMRYADAKELADRLVALRDSAGDAEDVETARSGLRGLAFEVAADEPTHSIVLSGPPESVSAVLDVVSELDRVPASVRVEVTVARIDLDDRLDLGFDYFIPTIGNPKAPDDLIASVLGNPSGGGVPTGPTTEMPFIARFTHTPLLLTFIDPSTNQSITIPLSETASLTMNARTISTDVVMRPNLLITAGDEHEIFAGDNIPIPVASSGTGAPGATGTEGTEGTGTVTQDPLLTTQTNIERQDVGTSLRITPTVGEQGGVTLEMRVEVSALADSVVGSVEEVGPTIRQAIVESKIRLRSGEIAVIATVARPRVERTETGVPWLKDLPVLGWAFRFTSEERRKNHLLIAARAEIQRPEATRDLADGLGRALGAPPAPAVRAEQEP
jgi:general secretion pathway protein D